MSSDVVFADKVRAIAGALAAADLPYAIGGALALAYCVGRPRATADIDVNVFVPTSELDRVLAALPSGVTAEEEQRAQLRRDAQARLRWGRTPVDLFLTNVDFHVEAASRRRIERWGDQEIAFLDCSDLGVFKAFFDRSKDWVDVEEMLIARTLDVERALGTLVTHLGGADHRVEHLRSLAATIRQQDHERPPTPILRDILQEAKRTREEDHPHGTLES